MWDLAGDSGRCMPCMGRGRQREGLQGEEDEGDERCFDDGERRREKMKGERREDEDENAPGQYRHGTHFPPEKSAGGRKYHVHHQPGSPFHQAIPLFAIRPRRFVEDLLDDELVFSADEIDRGTVGGQELDRFGFGFRCGVKFTEALLFSEMRELALPCPVAAARCDQGTLTSFEHSIRPAHGRGGFKNCSKNK